MHNNFKAISLSYKDTPLEIREMVAFDETACKRMLDLISEYTEISEALVISTCNRTEVFYSSPKNLTNDLIRLVGIVKDFEDMSAISSFFTTIDDNDQASRHLFYVALGLEAQVVGDLQIINQVKNAYQWSADQNMAGPYLHRLMHTIFFANKRVSQETPFRDGAASVSYATVELIDELTAALDKPKILVLGLGEIGEDVARNLQNLTNKEVIICNRTKEKANELAREFGFQAIPYSNFEKAAREADVIISSVVSDEPVINNATFKGSVTSHKYLFDLSLPRSIEESIEETAGLLLYNIDGIQSKASDALNKRVEAIPAVKIIIKESLTEFANWSREMEVSPTIHKLRNALEEIRQNELARHLSKLTPKESKLVESVTKNMIQKIIKLPVLQLKAACKRGEADSLIDVLNDLFDLESQPDQIKK